MTMEEIRARERENIAGTCKVCPACDGRACAGVIPGPGGKMTGRGFIRSYDRLHQIGVNLDTICDNRPVDTSTELFGRKMAFPVFAAPIAALKLHYGGYLRDEQYAPMLVGGCRNAGIAAFTGDGTSRKVFDPYLESIAQNDGWGVPTIKPWEDDHFLQKLRDVENCGAMAVASDIDAAGLRLLQESGVPVRMRTGAELARLIDKTRLPFVLKGIMTVRGALAALEAGAYGIVVSNHGGRVLDDTPATVDVLPEIVQAVGGRMKIFVDGGIRTGLDVFKVLALGADAALIGRPYPMLAHGGGQEAVELYSRRIGDELRDAMLMAGAKTIAEIGPHMVRRLED